MWVGRPSRLELVSLLAAGVTIVALCAALAALSYVSGVTEFHNSELYLDRMKDCQNSSLTQLGLSGAGKPDLPTLKSVTDNCFNYILYSDELGESNITRGMYIHQRYENNVILFMVVLITFSGVGLAGLQLLTSYNLASTTRAAVVANAAARREVATTSPETQGGGSESAIKVAADVSEVALEHGKLTVRSSVTGVIIIALSFAFFYVYVVSVYSVRVPADPPETASTNTATANATAQAPPGGNGPPPTN